MLTERMKKEKELNLSADATKFSEDWEDDMSVIEETAEDHWCMVSEDDMEEKEQPKGNVWFEEDSMDSPNIVVDKLKQLGLQDFSYMLLPSVKNPKNLLLMLHLLVGLFVVIHLAWDRYSWRSSAIHLEQELRQLTTEPIHQTIPPPRDLPQNDAFKEDWHPADKPDNVILDNCWVHARASVSFRECAEDAKDTMKEVTTEVVETAKTFAKHTWKAAKKFTKHATAAAAAAAARRRDRPY